MFVTFDKYVPINSINFKAALWNPLVKEAYYALNTECDMYHKLLNNIFTLKDSKEKEKHLEMYITALIAERVSSMIDDVSFVSNDFLNVEEVDYEVHVRTLYQLIYSDSNTTEVFDVLLNHIAMSIVRQVRSKNRKIAYLYPDTNFDELGSKRIDIVIAYETI